MDRADQFTGADCAQEGSVVMGRQRDALRACDDMSPKRKEEFLKMIWCHESGCYDLPGVRRIWEETSRSVTLTALSMFQYGVVIGKRMERMKRKGRGDE